MTRRPISGSCMRLLKLGPVALFPVPAEPSSTTRRPISGSCVQLLRRSGTASAGCGATSATRRQVACVRSREGTALEVWRRRGLCPPFQSPDRSVTSTISGRAGGCCSAYKAPVGRRSKHSQSGLASCNHETRARPLTCLCFPVSDVAGAVQVRGAASGASVGVYVREPRLGAADPVRGPLEHRRPGRERAPVGADREQARPAARGDQPAPLAGRERSHRPADPVDPPAPVIRVGHQQRLAPAAAAAATTSRPRSPPGPAPGTGAPPPARRS